MFGIRPSLIRRTMLLSVVAAQLVALGTIGANPLYAKAPPLVARSAQVRPGTAGEPPFAETIEWIRRHIGDGHLYYNITFRDDGLLALEEGEVIDSPIFDGCRLKITLKSVISGRYGNNNKQRDTENQLSIDLQRIDLRSLRVINHWWPENGIVIPDDPSRELPWEGPKYDLSGVRSPALEIRGNNFGSSGQASYSYLALPVPAGEMAERIRNAFFHAAKLCGAKEDPF